MAGEGGGSSASPASLVCSASCFCMMRRSDLAFVTAVHCCSHQCPDTQSVGGRSLKRYSLLPSNIDGPIAGSFANEALGGSTGDEALGGPLGGTVDVESFSGWFLML